MVPLSVVIVNWNTKDLILACLQSLAPSLHEKRIEVIVVDNGSCDGSQRAITAQFPDVRLIDTGANLGYGRACNIGMRASTAPYVCLLNSDILVRDGCLETLIAYMEAHPEVGMVGPRILGTDLKLQDTCRRLPTVWNNLCEALRLSRVFPRSAFLSGEHMFYFAHDREIMVEGLAGCFMLVRRKAIDEVGLFDEQFFLYCEETDWCKRFRAAGWLIAFCPEAEAIHAHRASSSKDPVFFAKVQIQSRLIYWRKHHSPLEVAGFRLAHVLIWLRRMLAAPLMRLTLAGATPDPLRSPRTAAACIRLLVTDADRSPLPAIQSLESSQSA
jgi:GT2 family glycosyltransferase